MALKLLAVGDLHLGRHPGGLPEDLQDRHAARALGPSAALARIADAAIAAGVDVVALAGDLVEQDDDFFEAYGDLYRAVAQLVDAGIEVIGVAGNHDVAVLPRLDDELPGFTLLGRGGRWESRTLTGRDGTQAILHGWSFPHAAVSVSPLLETRFARDGDLHPALGLLHCDRDQSGSRHAPVSSGELAAAGVDAWLLGHIHKPDHLTVAAPSGYLGSVTALRRTETGVRGPWLYRVGRSGIESVRQWPLAPLRWEEIDVDLSAIADAEDARGVLLDAVRRAARDAVGGEDPAQGADVPEPGLACMQPAALGLRVRCIGRTALRAQLERLLAAETLDDIPTGTGLRCFIGGWVIETLPEIDLAALADQPDPAGLLARRLRLLARDAADAERAELIERARAHLAAVAGDLAWQRLDRGALADADVAAWLRHAALAALDGLLAQRTGQGA